MGIAQRLAAAIERNMKEEYAFSAYELKATPFQFGVFTEFPTGELPEWIPYLPKPGSFSHAQYGKLEFSKERNADFVGKFKAGIYQRQLPVDAEHQTKLSGALGWITDMRLNEDGSVDAYATWTDRGKSLIQSERFKYISPELYEDWTDPASGTAYQNVAIGAALTTRPFFKEGSLRPLLATEAGLQLYEKGDEGMDEQNFAEKIAAFAEKIAAVESELTEEKARSQQLTEALDTSNERVAVLEKAATVRRFADIAGGDVPWNGDIKQHVMVLLGFADTFGEDSEQFKAYVQQQNAIAKQLAESAIFKEIGSNQGDTAGGGGSGALAQMEAKAKALQAEKGVTYQQAFSEILLAEPGLYDQYTKEK